MTVVKLPRMLSETLRVGPAHTVSGDRVAFALDDLFATVPGLRNHVLDESGAIRPHVSVFVDGVQADMDTSLDGDSEIRILHAVSGG